MNKGGNEVDNVKTSRVLIGVVVLLQVCVAANTAPAPPQPNFLVVSIDTLRADRLGCYGRPVQYTAALDRLAAQGLQFHLTISQSTATLPSHASIFTSRYASQHKAVWKQSEGVKLRDSEITLAELLSAGGYTTAAFTDGGEMTAGSGIEQGFQVYNNRQRGIAA
ncbi:sulfatase-like hydrolase/transferase, partial [bacterium]|nr:sulfatase-like hydrolase/transferase [candidate division CSSED10-310 bacterium]